MLLENFPSAEFSQASVTLLHKLPFSQDMVLPMSKGLAHDCCTSTKQMLSDSFGGRLVLIELAILAGEAFPPIGLVRWHWIKQEELITRFMEGRNSHYN